MYGYLENAVATLEAMRRTVRSLSDIELAYYLGGVMVASLALIALCIGWLRDRKRRKRRLLVERELYRVRETDGMRKGESKTVIDAFRHRFPSDAPPEKKPAPENETGTTVEEPKRKVTGDRRA